MAARLLGQVFVPDHVEDGATAVFTHRPGKPGGGVAIARAELEDALCPDHTGDLQAELARGRSDDGEAVLFGVGFHLLQLQRALRHQSGQVSR